MGRLEYYNIPTGSHYGKEEPVEAQHLTFRDVFLFLRSNIFTIGVWGLVGLTLGTVYLIRTPPSYVATTRLVMDPEQGKIVSQDANSGTVIIESAEIASQVEIVKSDPVAQAVIRQLDMTKDPEILNQRSWQGVIKDFIASVVDRLIGKSNKTSENVPSDEDLMRRVMEGFLSRVSVERVGQSYVLQIGYRSTDPQKAAEAANALAAAYIRNGMAERAQAAKLGAIWLESRLADVGRKARQAALAAEEFRNRNGITAVGNAATLDQQQLSDISNQVMLAKAATAAESAKLTTLLKVMKGEAPEDSVADTANDPQIQKIREDMRAAQTRLDVLRSRYTAGNPAIVSTEAEIARMKDAINNEYKRIEAEYRSNLDVAKTREHLVEEQFASMSKSGADKNIARVELSEMESRASTYRRLYENVLQQLSGALQTQSFPLGQARIVTPATAPFNKTWPKTSLVLSFSLAMGLSIGFFAALLRKGLDRRVNSGDRLRRELGISMLGRVPVYNAGLAAAKNKAIPLAQQPLLCVLDAPYSRFSESLRGVKNSLDAMTPHAGSLVVGVTSVRSGEGKTTIATNLAQLYQNEGQSVLLIDADFVGQTLTKLSENASKVGIQPIELAGMLDGGEIFERPGRSGSRGERASEPGEVTVAKTALRQLDHSVSGLSLPLLTTEQIRKAAVAQHRYGHLPALKEIIHALRSRYKIIILDMSGFENSADSRTISTYLDGIILVLGDPDKMKIDRLADALKSFGNSRLAIFGAIANRCDAKRSNAKLAA